MIIVPSFTAFCVARSPALKKIIPEYAPALLHAGVAKSSNKDPGS